MLKPPLVTPTPSLPPSPWTTSNNHWCQPRSSSPNMLPLLHLDCRGPHQPSLAFREAHNAILLTCIYSWKLDQSKTLYSLQLEWRQATVSLCFYEFVLYYIAYNSVSNIVRAIGKKLTFQCNMVCLYDIVLSKYYGYIAKYSICYHLEPCHPL